ncbi:ACP S-malonyltransferase [Streptomyces sp. NPDC093510]|uniref:ACP S-malonyltransferase n=1 Tax=Streptomyces sp. NPDC093510 TaxID=3155199 RepID=UPI00341FF94E
MGPTTFSDLGKFLLINPLAKELRQIADEVLGYSLFDAFRETDDPYAESAQVAFMVACTALAEWAQSELGVSPDAVVGPSFGEKPLIGFSGALDFPDAVAMTAGLARCTAEYFAVEHRDVVTQSFVRAPAEGLQELLAGMDERGEWHELSCLLDDGFCMISLHEAQLDEFQRQLKALGALPLYTMRPPMHSSLFAGLRDKAARDVIDGLALRDPKLLVVADQDGHPIHTAEELRTMLLDHFVRPVDWPAALHALRERGVDRLVIAGPDRLFGRVRCATSAFDVVTVDPTRAARRTRTGI